MTYSKVNGHQQVDLAASFDVIHKTMDWSNPVIMVYGGRDSIMTFSKTVWV